jgi:hypothetical protein
MLREYRNFNEINFFWKKAVLKVCLDLQYGVCV